MSDSDRLLNELGNDDPSLLSIRKLLMDIMVELGGTVGFAKMVAEDFRAADPGSPQRVQLDGKIIQALQTFGIDDAPESASEDELLALHRNLTQNNSGLVSYVMKGNEDDQ